MDKLENESLSETTRNKWRSSIPKAEQGIRHAKETVEHLAPIMKSIDSDLERAKRLPKEYDITFKNIMQVESQMERIKKDIPKIQTLASDIDEKSDRFLIRESALSEAIVKLKQQIAHARDIANAIKVGVNFYPNTTLELKRPESLPMISTNTKVSTFFKTDKDKGFLFYLGNENKTEDTDGRPQSNDYMALEVENGYLVLTTDLGNGSKRIINPKLISDGKWYEAIVEQNDNDITLIVREEKENGNVTVYDEHDTVPGDKLLFNLNNNSRLFVGGYPPDFEIQETIRESSFEGQIEGFKINNEEVGLWNFVDGQDNENGAIGRDKLKADETPVTGYRFNGAGFIELAAHDIEFRSTTSVKLKFKAERKTKDGLIFYAGKDAQNFISIEMKNAEILFQFKLGQGVTSIVQQSRKYNDDVWHTVEASRSGTKGELRIDEHVIYSGENLAGRSADLIISDSVFIGGKPESIYNPDVTSKNFNGCIDDVLINGNQQHLSQNKNSIGIHKGCPEPVSTILSFARFNPGYVKKDEFNASNNVQVNFKFITRSKNGVLLYGTNDDKTDTFAVALSDGHLYVTSKSESIKSDETYDDGIWHIVSAGHDAKKIWLLVDESNKKEMYSSFDPLFIQNGAVYFGGLAPDEPLPAKAIETHANYIGCIGDVTINSNRINFANSIDAENAIIGSCANNIFEELPDDKDNEIDFDTRIQPDQESGREDSKETIPITTIKPVPITTTAQPTPKPTEITRPPRVIETTTTPTTTTTALSPPTIPPTKPPLKQGECRLPVEPVHESTFDIGYRFGTSANSRAEYDKQLQIRPRKNDFTLSFNTSSSGGTLFYLTDSKKSNYISLYLEEGQV